MSVLRDKSETARAGAGAAAALSGVAGLLLLLLMSGCGGGGGGDTTSAGGTTTGGGTATAGVTNTTGGTTGGGDALGEALLVKVHPGVTVQAVAQEYGVAVEDGLPEDNLYRLRADDDEDGDALAARLAADPRLAAAEDDDGVRSPEASQTVAGDPIHVPFDFVGRADSRYSAIAVTFSGAGGPGAAAGDPGAPFRQIKLAAAHAVTRGAGITVAVLDTGVQADHPVLAARLLPGFNALAPGAPPADAADGARNEAFGHGTMVAGIVARVAPDARILPVRVLNGDGSGSVFDVVRGLRWAVANGAQVVNLSFGTPESSGILREAIGDARDAGVVIVSSAGNAGGDIRDFPAGYSETVSVAAVGADDRKAPFSNFGSHISLAAPGTAITSSFPGGTFASWSGTSFAAPFVAGVAALVRAANPGADSDKIADAMEETARGVDGANPGFQGRIGEGVVDAGRAVTSDRLD